MNIFQVRLCVLPGISRIHYTNMPMKYAAILIRAAKMITFRRFYVCLCFFLSFLTTYEPLSETPPPPPGFFAYAKTKPQISCAVTAQLISDFIFAAWIVQSLYFLTFRNFKSLTIFCGCTARFVSDLVGNPEDLFS